MRGCGSACRAGPARRAQSAMAGCASTSVRVTAYVREVHRLVEQRAAAAFRLFERER